MFKLLSGYPSGRLFLLTSLRGRKNILGTEFERYRQMYFPELTGTRYHGYGRLLLLADRMLTPLLAVLAGIIALSWRPQAVLTVAHGYFFLAAAAVRCVLRIPLVVIVHDDWLALTEEVYIFRRIAPSLYRWALRQGDLVYAVSEGMRSHLYTAYGVRADVFLPIALPNEYADADATGPSETFRIAFTGTIFSTVREGISLTAEAVNSGLLANRLGRPVELLLSTRYPEEAMVAHGWLSDHVHNQGWLSENDYKRFLASVDLLLVPVAFHASTQFYADTSFPSKLADYTASGRPVLAIAPRGSTTWDYCSQNKNAILVTEPTVDAMVDAIADAVSSDRMRGLAAASLTAFHRNHDVIGKRSWFQQQLTGLVAGHT